MPQKKYGPEGTAQPVSLTQSQVQALASGQAVSGIAGFEGTEPQRPRDLTADEVEALRTGKQVNFEALTPIAPAGPDREPERPRDLSPEDVSTLRAGKDFKLESRGPLRANYARKE
jgi:hypothetical protein